VYPDLVNGGRGALAGSDVKVASVATAFQSGRASLAVKLADVADAVTAGADEVDMVIDRGAFLAGRYGQVAEEIRAVREACGPAHLKVILETGELATLDNVARASWLAMLSGADFIKTSTGKVSPARDTPGRPGHAGRRGRLRGGHGAPGRREGGRRGAHRQGRGPLPGPGQGDRRAGVAHPGPVSGSAPSSLLNDLLMQRRKQLTGVYPPRPTTSPSTESASPRRGARLGALAPSRWAAPFPRGRPVAAVAGHHGERAGRPVRQALRELTVGGQVGRRSRPAPSGRPGPSQHARTSGRAQIAPARRPDLGVPGREVLAVAGHHRIQAGRPRQAPPPEQEGQRVQPRPTAGAVPVHRTRPLSGEAIALAGAKSGWISACGRSSQPSVRSSSARNAASKRLLIRGQAAGGSVSRDRGGRDLRGRGALVDQVMPPPAVADVVTGQGVEPAEQITQPGEGPPAAIGSGALDVPGDQQTLPFVHRHGFLRGATVRRGNSSAPCAGAGPRHPPRPRSAGPPRGPGPPQSGPSRRPTRYTPRSSSVSRATWIRTGFRGAGSVSCPDLAGLVRLVGGSATRTL